MKTYTTKKGVEFDAGPVVTGSLLVGIGGLVAFIGFVIASLHALNQGVRWVGSLENSPTAVARNNWGRVKAAGTAGAGAWKNSSSTVSALN